MFNGSKRQNVWIENLDKPQWDVIRCRILADYEETAGDEEAKAAA